MHPKNIPDDSMNMALRGLAEKLMEDTRREERAFKRKMIRDGIKVLVASAALGVLWLAADYIEKALTSELSATPKNQSVRCYEPVRPGMPSCVVQQTQTPKAP